MRDRLLIFAIAVDQFLLALALMGIALYGLPLLLIFGLWGLINAILLLLPSIAFSRQGALIWHIVFVGLVLMLTLTRLMPNNESYRNLQLWAVLDLAAVFYLAKTTLHQLRNRKKSGR